MSEGGDRGEGEWRRAIHHPLVVRLVISASFTSCNFFWFDPAIFPGRVWSLPGQLSCRLDATRSNTCKCTFNASILGHAFPEASPLPLISPAPVLVAASKVDTLGSGIIGNEEWMVKSIGSNTTLYTCCSLTFFFLLPSSGSSGGFCRR